MGIWIIYIISIDFHQDSVLTQWDILFKNKYEKKMHSTASPSELSEQKQNEEGVF